MRSRNEAGAGILIIAVALSAALFAPSREVRASAPSEPVPVATLKDCSQAKSCSDACYCHYGNCSDACKDGDVECVNGCLKSLWACLDDC